jgi:hypothetical protein
MSPWTNEICTNQCFSLQLLLRRPVRKYIMADVFFLSRWFVHTSDKIRATAAMLVVAVDSMATGQWSPEQDRLELRTSRGAEAVGHIRKTARTTNKQTFITVTLASRKGHRNGHCHPRAQSPSGQCGIAFFMTTSHQALEREHCPATPYCRWVRWKSRRRRKLFTTRPIAYNILVLTTPALFRQPVSLSHIWSLNASPFHHAPFVRIRRFRGHVRRGVNVAHSFVPQEDDHDDVDHASAKALPLCPVRQRDFPHSPH